jgi:cellulose synthase/poly-beta-1,6-N-acetylglucosamine synthase-like glycosyltransferase
MEKIYEISQCLLLIWLGFCTIHVATLSIAGLFFREKEKQQQVRSLPKIALLIPAYQENEVIISTAKEALKQSYKRFEVFVIADSLNQLTLKTLAQLKITVLEVTFKKSTKAKALNFVLNKLDDSYDMVVVLDADNHMCDDSLANFAAKYAQGYNAIQGHRTAKNKGTNFAILDSISEEMNNHIYCKGTQTLGLTSRLIGSGMGFDFTLFKQLMQRIDAVGGFDKVLELKLLKSNNKIHYTENILVYDEKVSQSKVFSNQRKRWISSQYYYLKKYFFKSIVALLRGKVNYFMKASQLLLPPRMVFPVLLLVFFIIALIVGNEWLSLVWASLFCLLCLAYSIAIPKKFWNLNMLYAAATLPKALFVTISSLFTLKGANNKFIHTPHTFTKND